MTDNQSIPEGVVLNLAITLGCEPNDYEGIATRVTALREYVVQQAEREQAAAAERGALELKVKEQDGELCRYGELEKTRLIPVMGADSLPALERVYKAATGLEPKKAEEASEAEYAKQLEGGIIGIQRQKETAAATEKAAQSALVRLCAAAGIALEKPEYTAAELEEKIGVQYNKVNDEAAKEKEKYGKAHAALGELYGDTVGPLGDEELKKLSIEQLVGKMRGYARWAGRRVGNKLQSLYEEITGKKTKANVTVDDFVKGVSDGFQKVTARVQKYMGVSQRQHGELAKLTQHTKNMRYLMATSEQLPQEATVYHERGEVSFKAGNYAEALNYFTLAMLKDPTYVWSIFNMGASLCELGRVEDALPLMEIAEETVGKSEKDKVYRVKSYKGFVLEKLGRRGEAIAAYMSALKLNPKDDQANEGINRLQKSQKGDGNG